MLKHRQNKSSDSTQHDFADRSARVSTFAKWPYKDTNLISQMADSGLVYSGHDTEAYCYSCGFVFTPADFNDSMPPLLIHTAKSPLCPHIRRETDELYRMKATAWYWSYELKCELWRICEETALPMPYYLKGVLGLLDIKQKKDVVLKLPTLRNMQEYCAPDSEERRVLLKMCRYDYAPTTAELYPLLHPKPWEEIHPQFKSDDFARAGFRYLGDGKHVCFDCNLRLENMYAPYSPYVHHASRSPRCGVVQMCCTEEFRLFAFKLDFDRFYCTVLDKMEGEFPGIAELKARLRNSLKREWKTCSVEGGKIQSYDYVTYDDDTKFFDHKSFTQRSP